MGTCSSSASSRSTWDNEFKESSSSDAVQEGAKRPENINFQSDDIFSTPTKPKPNPIVLIETPRQRSLYSMEPEGPTRGIRVVGLLNSRNQYFLPSSENYFSDRIKIEKVLIDPSTPSTIMPLKECAQIYKLSVLYPSTVVNALHQYHWSVSERKDTHALCLVITPRSQSDLFKIRLMSDLPGSVMAQPSFLLKELRFALCSDDIEYICTSEAIANFEFYHQEKLKNHYSSASSNTVIPRSDVTLLGQNVLSRFVCVSTDRFLLFYELEDKQKLSLDLMELRNLASLLTRELRLPKDFPLWDASSADVIKGGTYEQEADDNPLPPLNPLAFGAFIGSGDSLMSAGGGGSSKKLPPLHPKSPGGGVGSSSHKTKQAVMRRTLSSPLKSAAGVTGGGTKVSPSAKGSELRTKSAIISGNNGRELVPQTPENSVYRMHGASRNGNGRISETPQNSVYQMNSDERRDGVGVGGHVSETPQNTVHRLHSM